MNLVLSHKSLTRLVNLIGQDYDGSVLWRNKLINALKSKVNYSSVVYTF